MIILKKIPSRNISSNLLKYIQREIPELSSCESLSQVSEFGFTYDNTELIRQAIFSYFRGEGNKSYKDLIRAVLNALKIKKAFIQKIPTVRVHLPGRGITSFHTDNWYGHHPDSLSIWVPLVNVSGANTLWFLKEINANNSSFLKKFVRESSSLKEIDDYFMEKSKPQAVNIGEALAFKASEVHGTVVNETKISRISFDFRISLSEKKLGNKPLSNYLLFDKSFKTLGTKADKKIDVASYSLYLKDIPSKVQILLASAISHDMSFNIVRNESEIMSLPHLPVLQDLLLSKKIKGVVIYSLKIFKTKKQFTFFSKLIKKEKKFLFLSSELRYFYG